VSPGGAWSGTGITGNTFNPVIAGPGDHIIQYDVVNGACANSDTKTIHVDSDVDATITPVGPFCEVDAGVILNTVSPDGAWSGTGVVGNVFDPTITGPGDYIIHYDVVNGACADSDTKTLHVDPNVNATITPTGPFCESDIPITLTAITLGGTWSGTGITDPIAGIFSPSSAEIGDHVITYNIGIGACSDIDNISIHIDASPNATITPIAPVCEDNGNIILTAAQAGGIWSGNFISGNTFNPMAAGQGNHNVTYNNVQGACSDFDQITIHVDTIPDATITPDGPFCEDFEFAYLISISSGGTWSGTGITNPATGQFSPLFSGPGDFIINYDIVNGVCADNDSFTIHVDEIIDPTINPIEALCQSEGQIVLTAVNPGGLWAGQGIIDPINGILDPSMIIQGDNTMTYTISNGECISSDLHIYQVDPEVDATILSNPGTICISNAPFTLNSVESGGIWSGQGISNPSTGAFTPDLAGSGTHEIIYFVENGTCEDHDTIYITVIPMPNATITPTGPFCETDAATVLTATTLGGIWSGVGVIDNVFNPAIAGPGNHIITYDLTVGTCSNSDTKTIHVDQTVDATIAPINPICENSAPINLIAATSGGTWSGLGVNGSQFNPTITGQGTHSINYMVSNGVCNDSDNIDIFVDEYNIVNISPAGPFCENDAPANLLASIAGGIWSGQGISDPINGTFDPSISGTGTFNIDYTFNNGAYIINTSIPITVNPNPTASIFNLNPEYCEGEQFVIVVVSPLDGVLSGPGVDGFVFNPSIAGPGSHIIQYDITNIYGCDDNTQSNVTVYPSPVVSVWLPSDQYCFDDDVVAINGTPLDGVFSGNGVIGNKFSPTVAGSGTHTITYTYIDANGCEGINTFIVEVNEPLALDISGQSLICFGANDGQVSVNVTGGVAPYTYAWNDPSGSTTSTVNDLASNTYNVTITDAWGCDETNQITISSPSSLSVSISSSINPSCYGETSGTAQASVSGGTPPYTYLWDNPEASETSYLNNLGIGTYNVTITDNNGCSGTIGVTITQPDELITSIATSTNVSCNGGNNGSATVNAIGGTGPYEYYWSNPSHTPLSTANHLTAGHYDVIITDFNGCSTSTGVDISEPTVITSTISHADVVCTHNLGSASILVNGGIAPYSYHWSNGSNNSSINNLIANTYIVTVSDDNNCQHITSVEIGITGTIHTNIHEEQGILCHGDNNGILQAYTNNGSNPLDYFWSNGSHAEFNNNLFAGNYEVTIIDSWGCTGTNTYNLSDQPEIIINESITSVGCSGDESGSITLQVSGGTPSYLINWSTGTNGLSISNISPGTYQVTITDANSCNITESYNVGVAAPIDISIIAKNPSCFGYNDGTIQLSAIGGTAPFNYLFDFNGSHFTGSNANNLQPGTYTIYLEDAQGCKLDTIVKLTEPEEMDYSYITIDPSCIGNADGYIEITAIGGNPPYIYQWDDQASSLEYIAGLMQGNYTFTITDSQGCKISTEAVILADTDVDCIIIPNAFTPNTDGINDTWIIENIEMFPWALIQVFNRWGQLVFEGYGAGNPWDGEWNGNIVPTGSYIYSVNLFNGTKYCGIVTIVQ
jgi:gliding motility-associated-like protein